MTEKKIKEDLDIELEAPASFTDPEELYKDLIKGICRYHPSTDIRMIEKRDFSSPHSWKKRGKG